MGNLRQLKYVARFSVIYVQSDTSDWYTSERSAWYFEFCVSLRDEGCVCSRNVLTQVKDSRTLSLV